MEARSLIKAIGGIASSLHACLIQILFNVIGINVALHKRIGENSIKLIQNPA